MGEAIDFAKAWEDRHPDAPPHRVQLVLNELSAAGTGESQPAPYDHEAAGIDKEFWLRDIGRRMLAAVRLNKGKPVGKGIMDDYNRLTPQEQEEVILIISQQGGK